MSTEVELNQKEIDDLLTTANKELALDAPPSETAEPQEPPAIAVPTEVSTALPNVMPAPLSIKNSASLVVKQLKQSLTKKMVCGICLLFTIFIGAGALLGYKMAGRDVAFAGQPPHERLIQFGIPFEEKNFISYAGRGNKEIIDAFLEADMPVNTVRTSDGWTALMSACLYKKADIVELLLEKNAAVNLQDKYGKTALLQATAVGAEDIVNMLLEAGADPNLADNNGRTPLIEAYAKKQAKISELLKNAGAITAAAPSKIIKSPSVLPPPHLNKEQQTPLSATLTEEYRLSQSKAGFVQIGMSLADLQKKYPSLTVSEKYVDGSKITIANLFINSPNNPSLELELSSGKLKLVSTISAYDGQFATDKQITVLSTVGEIRNQYTVNDIKILNNSLFLVVKSLKMLFELDLNKVPSEWLDTGNPTSIPSDTKIKRIVIY